MLVELLKLFPALCKVCKVVTDPFYRVAYLFVCSAVIVALILLCLIDFIASSKDQVYMFLYYIIFFVMYV